MEIGDSHDPYGAIVTGSMYEVADQETSATRKTVRVGSYFLVQLWLMVQDREHTRSAPRDRPEDAGEGSPQVVFWSRTWRIWS
jgi:hypothetical protein